MSVLIKTNILKNLFCCQFLLCTNFGALFVFFSRYVCFYSHYFCFVFPRFVSSFILRSVPVSVFQHLSNHLTCLTLCFFSFSSDIGFQKFFDGGGYVKENQFDFSSIAFFLDSTGSTDQTEPRLALNILKINSQRIAYNPSISRH